MIARRVLRLSLSLQLAAASGLAASGPAVPEPGAAVVRSRFLMGTLCEVTAYGAGSAQETAAAVAAALDEIARLESVLSDWRDGTEMSRLNRQSAGAPFPCSTDLFDFLSEGLRLHGETDGAFDLTVAPLMAAWDLRGAGRIPSPVELDSALSRVGSKHLVLDQSRRAARFEVPGMAIDPGGLGKGFALDAAGRLLRARGVTSALLDFGGQVLALGAPPGREAWEVGIAHPERRDQEALAVLVRDASISTSGNSERGLRVEGRLIGHVLDPRSGRPTGAGVSATIIAPTATEADAFSTALLVMGPADGIPWAEARPQLSALFLSVDPRQGLRLAATRNVNHGDSPLRPARIGADHQGERR